MSTMDEVGILQIPENTLELFKLLSKCSLAEYFNAFIEEEFNDDSLRMLDPEKMSFWNTIPKIVTKVGAQLRLHHELSLLLEGSQEADEANDDDIPQEFYKSFNENIVSIFLFLFGTVRTYCFATAISCFKAPVELGLLLCFAVSFSVVINYFNICFFLLSHIYYKLTKTYKFCLDYS